MFSLHERTQRRACRIAFVAICVVPTVLVLGWATYFNRPWQELDWRQAVESTFHVRAVVNDVSAARPWQREFSSLELSSLESSRPLAEVRQLRIESSSLFAAEHVDIHWSQLGELVLAFRVWLASETFAATQWQVDAVTLTGPENSSCELKNLCCEGAVSSSGARQVLIGAELTGGQKVRLLMERAVDGKIQVALDTQQAPLPTWLLADVVPGAARWGQANFSGVLQLVADSPQVVGKYRGTIGSMNTQTWIGTDQLQTRVDLQFDLLSWRNHRIQAAAGGLETTEGHIHQALLSSLKEKLYCTLSSHINDKVERHPFQRAACRFQLNEQGLTVTGLCNGEGCLMVADGKPLVMQPTYSDLPVAHLVQVFCPLERSWLPATREATGMAERLPLPESASKSGTRRQTEAVQR